MVKIKINAKYSRGFFVSLSKYMEEGLKQWLDRPITKRYKYVFIDGMGVSVKENEKQKKVVIWALGIDEKGNKDVLGHVLSRGESWHSVKGLIEDMQRRGLQTPDLFISDGAAGIESALKMSYPNVPRQLCAIHLTRYAKNKIIDYKQKQRFYSDAIDIYTQANNKTAAIKAYEKFCKKWANQAKALRTFKRSFHKTLIYFRYNPKDWKSIYTSNPIENHIGVMRAWTSKYKYFAGRHNLNLALYSYFYSKQGDIALNQNSSVF